MTPNRTRSGLFETPRIKNTAPKSEGGALSRSSVSDPPRAKVTPTTPRAAKSCKQTTPKADPSPHLHLPVHGPRHSVDHFPRSASSLDHSALSSVSIEGSPRSVDSRLSIQQRAPRVSPLSDKGPRVVKGSELQTELNAAKEQLKAATDRLNSLEDEKAWALEELEAAKREADDANRKLEEALAAQRQAEEITEIEKFRVVELEQAGIEAARQKEEAWNEELERLRHQSTLDASNLRTTAQELQRLKQELAMETEAKNTAASHADDALRIAEVNAEKAAKLSAEIDRLKASLDSKVESKEEETAERINKLNSYIESLQSELGRAKEAEAKLTNVESLVEGLRIEVADARRAEADARATLDEWVKQVEDVEARVEEAARSEELASASLASATRKLEGCNASLRDADSEISSLKRKVELLEMELRRYRAAAGDSNAHLETVKGEISESERAIESLKSEMERADGEKDSAADNENGMLSSLPVLLEEKRRLLAELEASRDDVDTTRSAMEGLASALQEVSSEARCSHEQLAAEQAKLSDARAQIDESESALESMEKRYEVILVEAKEEVERLVNAAGASRKGTESAKSERSSKEHDYASLMRKSEEEIAGIKERMGKLASKLVETEVEAAAAKEEGARLLSGLMQAKFEAASAKEAAEEAKAEVLQLKGRLLDQEKALQSVSQENEELRAREAAAIDKIRELSSLLEVVESNMAGKDAVAPGLVPKTAGFPDEDAWKDDEACIDKTEVCEGLVEDAGEARSADGGGEGKALNAEEWGSCKAVGLSPEGRSEEEESLGRSGSFRVRIEKESFGWGNGGASPSEGPPEEKKKKKNFLVKFKSLIKKKSGAR